MVNNLTNSSDNHSIEDETEEFMFFCDVCINKFETDPCFSLDSDQFFHRSRGGKFNPWSL